MTDERKEIVPLPQGSQLVPEFIQAIKSIQKGRKKIEENKRTPEFVKASFETAPEWLQPHMLLYYLELARETRDGQSLIHSSWQSVNQVFTDSLELKNDFNHSTPQIISQAVKDKHKDDSEGVVVSRNIILSVTRQQIKDKEVTKERAVELALEMVKETLVENTTTLMDAPSVQHSSQKHEATIATQCVTGLDIAYSADPDSEQTKSLKATCYFGLDLIVQRQAIKQNWYIMEMEDGPEKGKAVMKLMEAMDEQLNHLTWVAENSESKIDDEKYFEAIGQTIKTYGRVVGTAYGNGAITKEEYVQGVNRLVKMTWNVMAKKYDEKTEVIDGYHTLITRSGAQMFAMAHPAPWNSDQKKLIRDMIDQESGDKYYSTTLYGFLGSLAQMGWCDKETMDFLKEIAFPKSESPKSSNLPQLP